MDFEQALFYLEKVDRRIRFENFTVSNEVKYELWQFYAYYIRSAIYMYQSKLQEATECAGVAKSIAIEGDMERGQFEAELVEI